MVMINKNQHLKKGDLTMKKMVTLLLVILSSMFLYSSEKKQDDVISLFKGSKKVYDDKIGFETHYYLTGPTSVASIDGKIRRQFCEVPKGVSAYEVIKNYEKAIQSKGGKIIYLTKKIKRYKLDNGEWYYYIREGFAKARKKHSKIVHGHFVSHLANQYVVGKISTKEHDIIVSVAAADGYYELVTVVVEPMDMNKVSLNVLNDGIAANGKVAIYDIYFDTGKSEVKNESANALTIIAKYLKGNPAKKFLIVGHTDNVGDFKANLALSTARANAVVKRLVTKHGVKQTQIIPYGVSSASPQMSNSTEKGKTKNRRVELVEL
jgi:outer membrane protein OmpA-like peptidoglycan-associated protein